MTSTPLIPLDPAMCAALDVAWTAWARSDERQQTVRSIAQTHGYAAIDTDLQLTRVAHRSTGAALRACAEAEAQLLEAPSAHHRMLPAHITNRSRPEAVIAPKRVLHLVASTVPGLVLESIAHTLALGADVVVRPSSSECTLEPWRALLHRIGSPLAEHIAIVDELPEPGTVDAAVVFGSDTTVAHVRRVLDPAAAGREQQSVPVAGYGTRHGIAIVDAPSIADLNLWVHDLADDVAMFLQRGCMSPASLLITGKIHTAEFDAACARIAAALTNAWDRHRDPAWEVPAVSNRRASDATTLDELFGPADAAPDRRHIRIGTLELDCVHVPTDTALAETLDADRSFLQTAVVIASDAGRRIELAAIATHAGCSRTCDAGRAHDPAGTWPHDGIGWFIPLLV